MRNLAEIDYVKTADGKIKVTDIRNFLSCEEIEERYGSEVLRIYMNKYPRMYKTSDICVDFVYKEAFVGRGFIQVGYPESNESFSKIIGIAKSAGQNLVDAIREVKDAEKAPVKTIVI